MTQFKDSDKIEKLLEASYSKPLDIPVIDKKSILDQLPDDVYTQNTDYQLLESIVWRLVPICCIFLVLLHTTDNYLDDLKDKNTSLSFINTILEVEVDSIFKLS